MSEDSENPNDPAVGFEKDPPPRAGSNRRTGERSYRLGIVLPERFPLPPVHGFCTAIELWTHWFAPRARERAEVTIFSVPHPEFAGGIRDGIEYRYVRPNFVDLKLLPWLFKAARSLGSRAEYWQSTRYYRSYAHKIGHLVRDLEIDVVHLHNIAQFAPAIRAAAPRARIVLDIKWHGLVERAPYYDYAILRHELAESCLGAIDHVVTPSHYMVDATRENYPELDGRLSYVPNGAEPEVFRPVPCHGEPGRAVRIFFSGRLTPEKGAHHLLAAFRRVLERVDVPLELLIAGEFWTPGQRLDGFRAQIMSEIESLGDRVRLLGFLGVDDLARAMGASDLFVHPVEWKEPFSMCVLEAMSSGLPVVATSTGGTPEQIEDGVEGLLVPPGDPEAMAEAMVRLVADEELRRRMGGAGRERVMQNFTWQHVADQMHAIYNGVLSASRALS